MCATFTDDDVGKRVETASGEPIGSVRMTEADTAYVDTNADAGSAIQAILESDADEDIVPMDGSAIAEITDDAIRLADERASPDDSGGAEPVVERDEDTGGRNDSDEQRTLGTEPGDPGEPAESVEGRSGQDMEPSTEEMDEAGKERHADKEDAPPEGDRTVTTERGEKEDQ
ncbi:hypothetical protein [Natrinema sp. 1APR25-10V2]|uniref:hypothetical protein n=1 Tax=Natrinema sp. 1APR25-10V2 TaxID=2951081 RepID=UPI0028770CE6|nr:hypothetical protein [Natrinema sp. 1APR25-10V2]MDS0477792.1 hypothetical protein [Natrinema sp. 1APR25-10V2]